MLVYQNDLPGGRLEDLLLWGHPALRRRFGMQFLALARQRAGGGGAIGANGRGCPSLVVLLPHEDGVQVQALLPQSAASKLCAKHNCLVYYP
eukprot:s2348_g5.t1